MALLEPVDHLPIRTDDEGEIHCMTFPKSEVYWISDKLKKLINACIKAGHPIGYESHP